jgi:hypothetical protein
MKKCVPAWRSSSSSVSPAESVGSTSTSSAAYTSIDQTNSGMRIHVIPGVRRRWIVTRKLIAPKSDESVSTCSERIQRSIPWPGLKADSLSGA